MYGKPSVLLMGHTIGKQYNPRCDGAERRISYHKDAVSHLGLLCLLKRISSKNENIKSQLIPPPPKKNKKKKKKKKKHESLTHPVDIGKSTRHLRNEFHFSVVHGAMNRSGSRAKWMNPEGVHVSFASDPLRFIAPWTTEKLNSLLIFTFISLYRLLKNHQGGHSYQQTENLHTVCVQTAERRRRLQCPIRLARFMFFLRQVWITSRRVTQCCSWKYEHRWTSNGSSKEVLEKCKYKWMNMHHQPFVHLISGRIVLLVGFSVGLGVVGFGLINLRPFLPRLFVRWLACLSPFVSMPV